MAAANPMTGNLSERCVDRSRNPASISNVQLPNGNDYRRVGPYGTIHPFTGTYRFIWGE